jgi:hypothetical protein
MQGHRRTAPSLRHLRSNNHRNQAADLNDMSAAEPVSMYAQCGAIGSASQMAESVAPFLRFPVYFFFPFLVRAFLGPGGTHLYLLKSS